MLNGPRLPRPINVLVNPTPIVELGSMFTALACGVVVSLHASTPAATAAAAKSTRCGLAAAIKTSATWDKTRRSGTDIMTPDAGLGAGSFVHPSKTESAVEPAHSACRADLEPLCWIADALSGGSSRIRLIRSHRSLATMERRGQKRPRSAHPAPIRPAARAGAPAVTE